MIDLKPVAGIDVDVASRRDTALAHLSEVMAGVESGKISPDKFAMILIDSEVDKFSCQVHYHGRATEMLGYLEIMRHDILSDVLE